MVPFEDGALVPFRGVPRRILSAASVRGVVTESEVDGEAVRIQKAARMDLKWARALDATLTEWTDEADDDL